jgi:hypothetical protein
VVEYLRRDPNPITRDQVRQRLDDLFRSCGGTHPTTVTEGDLVEWFTAVAANNSARGRFVDGPDARPGVPGGRGHRTRPDGRFRPVDERYPKA